MTVLITPYRVKGGTNDAGLDVYAKMRKKLVFSPPHIFFDYTNVSECILGAVLPCLPACSCHKHSMLINSLIACNFTSHLSSDSFCTETEL